MLKIYISRGKPSTMSELTVEYEGLKSVWGQGSFERTKLISKDTVFDTINQYFARLSKERQQKIFALYEELHEDITHGSSDARSLLEHLRNRVAELIDLIDCEELDHFCKFHARFYYPPTLKEHYTDTEPRESTYIRKDYYGLLYLATILKAILPLWGELIKRTSRDVGSLFKEHVCTSVLGNSALFNHQAMQRLKEYIEDMSSKVEVPNTAIHNNIGTTMLPEWLLGQALVRRLALSEVSVDGVSIISNIYNYVSSLTEKMDQKFTTRVQNKEQRSINATTGEEDNTSVAEVYKIKQEVPDSYIVTYEYWLESVEGIVSRIRPDLDRTMMNACIDRLLKDRTLDPYDWRLQIVGLITGDVLPMRVLPDLGFVYILRLVGLSQAILFDLGYEDLAVLLTAEAEEAPLDVLYGDGSSGAYRSRPTTKEVEALVSIYKHYCVTKKDQLEKKDAKTTNEALHLIESINRQTTTVDWVVRSPIAHSNPDFVDGRRFEIPSNIKNQLAQLIIAIKGDQGVLRNVHATQHQPKY